MSLLVLLIVPFCIGLLPMQLVEKEKRNPAAVLTAGYLCMMALFQLLAVPLVLRVPQGFELLATVYSLCLGALSLAGAAFGLRRLAVKRREGERLLPDLSMMERTELVFWLLFAALVIFQLVMGITHASFDGDDAYYVAHSVAAEQTGSLYRILPYTGRSTSVDLRHALAPLPIWEAYLARAAGVPAAVMAHTVLPVFLTLLTYLVYYLIGKRLFSDREQLPVFLLFAGILQIFGNVSIYTPATFFLMRTWQGKAVVANLILPVLWWLLLWIFDGRKERKAGLWVLLFLTNTAAALCTSMGSFFAALLLCVTGIVIAACRRSFGTLVKLGLTALPCAAYMLLYFAMTHGL